MKSLGLEWNSFLPQDCLLRQRRQGFKLKARGRYIAVKRMSCGRRNLVYTATCVELVGNVGELRSKGWALSVGPSAVKTLF